MPEDRSRQDPPRHDKYARASSTWAEATVVLAIILRCIDAQRHKTGAGKLAGNRKFPKPAPVRVKLTMPSCLFRSSEPLILQPPSL